MARLSKNFLVNDIIEEQLQVFAKRYLQGKMLDIGCGIKPYRQLVSPYIAEHVGLDHIESFHDSSNVDIFGTAYQIPVKDNFFDSVLCTFVLEHLEEPYTAIQECHRVLKHQGYAVYAMPHIWHLHEEPRDFYRYTKYGLKYLFEKSRFPNC